MLFKVLPSLKLIVFYLVFTSICLARECSQLLSNYQISANKVQQLRQDLTRYKENPSALYRLLRSSDRNITEQVFQNNKEQIEAFLSFSAENIHHMRATPERPTHESWTYGASFFDMFPVLSNKELHSKVSNNIFEKFLASALRFELSSAKQEQEYLILSFGKLYRKLGPKSPSIKKLWKIINNNRKALSLSRTLPFLSKKMKREFAEIWPTVSEKPIETEGEIKITHSFYAGISHCGACNDLPKYFLTLFKNEEKPEKLIRLKYGKETLGYIKTKGNSSFLALKNVMNNKNELVLLKGGVYSPHTQLKSILKKAAQENKDIDLKNEAINLPQVGVFMPNLFFRWTTDEEASGLYGLTPEINFRGKFFEEIINTFDTNQKRWL